MPVRSLRSPLLKWPDRATVEAALRAWAADAGRHRTGLERVGYFGSYARGDWGVGSDLDVVIIVRTAPAPFYERAAHWDTIGLPVPVDLLVYTVPEWANLAGQPTHFARTLMEETHWVWPPDVAS